MFTFQPMTDEEIDAINIIEEGKYSFEVLRSIRKTSQKGNPMAELNIRFWDNKGQAHTIFDYLVFSAVPLNIKKVKHFCDATGLIEQYKKGEIPEELGGYSGQFIIGIQEAEPNSKGGFYPKKNIVIDYLKVEA